MYRRLQSGLLRAAAWAASTSKNRNKELPCLLMCPSRCLPALESSLGIIPTYVPICLPQWNRSGVPDDQHVDRKSTRLNSSHSSISYAVFCLKKNKNS